MVYGNPVTDKISLNEITLWGGYPKNPNMNPEAASYIPKIREALFKEDYKKADSLTRFVQGYFSKIYKRQKYYGTRLIFLIVTRGYNKENL